MSEYVFETNEPIEGCAKCPIRHKQGSAWCQYLMKWTPTNEETERHPNCPLKELPPHGRLIAVTDVMKELAVTTLDSDTYDLVVHILDRIPTVLEASET